MKRFIQILIIPFLLTNFAFAQNSFTIEDIWKTYKYYPFGLSNVTHGYDNKHFYLIDGDLIIKLPYENGPYDTVLDFSKFKNLSIQNFVLQPKENKILVANNSKDIRRNSFEAIYYEISLQNKEEKALIDSNTYCQNPTYNSSGNDICYFMKNNLFIKHNDNTTIQITSDGKDGEIINGMPDWVYEEEFDLLQAFSWSPDNKYIGYLKFNETQVPSYQIPFYDSIYPTYKTFKYPKAGNVNSIVTANLYNINSKQTIQIPIPIAYEYIPEIRWIDSLHIALTLLNRHQNNIKILVYSIDSKKSDIVYSYENKTFVDIPSYFTPIPKTSTFIIRDDRDGFLNLYLYDYSKGLQKQITKNKGDVTAVYGYFESGDRVIYQATNSIPTERYVFSTTINSGIDHIYSTKSGTHSVSMSKNGNAWIHEFSSVEPSLEISIATIDSLNLRKTITNSWMQPMAKDFKFSPVEFFKIPTENNEYLHASIIKPLKFKSNKKYPVIVMVYGGPMFQKVTNEWTYDYYWSQYLALHGYIVVSVDCRGTDGRGSNFRKQTYLHLGEKESYDFDVTSTYLKKLSYVDSTNMAIEGWSYGAYISLLTVAKYPNSYKSVIAIAPVNNWGNYDNIYTERYMQLPSENPDGYKESNIMTYAKDIKASILLAHGTADDNVHPQNSFELARYFIDNEKDFDFLIFPNDEHSLYGENSRLYLYQKYFDFVEKELKPKK
jgi:dipeptidyl-peptidase 4